MATVLNTLYPPSVNSYLPAFPYDETAKILFSLSPFNSISEIEFIHVSVVDQKTNENILVRKGKEKIGEKEIDVSIPIPVLIFQVWPMAGEGEEPVDKNNLNNCLLYDRKTGMFKVEIPLENIKTKYWNIGQYYKIQLRFDSTPSFEYNNYIESQGQSQNLSFLLNTTTIDTSNGEIKVQENPSFDISKLNSYLSDHLGYFSEWSQVCLIRPILKPKIVLNGFSEGQNSQEDFEGFSIESIPQLSLGNLWITGRMELNLAKDDYKKEKLNLETETLNSYQISIFKGNKLLLQEKKIFTANNLADNSINEINSLISLENIDKNEIDSNSTYFLKIDAFTSSGYKIQNNFFVSKLLSEEDNFKMVRNIDNDQENGLLQLSAAIQIPVGEGAGDGNYKLTIKRSSDRSDFQNWEVIKIFDISPSKLYQSGGKNYFVFCQKNAISLKKLQKSGVDFPDFSLMLKKEEDANKISSAIVDNTIGSLNWYKYSFQLESYDGLTYKRQETEMLFSEFEHAILSRGKKQLALKFDCAISNVKPVTNRMKTDTLGGKYPKFTENAILGYKQMSISGKISSQVDENELFLSKNILSSEAYSDYYETKGNAGCFKRGNWLEYQDWLWEREFREEAVKWLNDGEPKLLRTLTEGNMSVMLTDINLTPDKALGRRLYNFSATVYEVGDGYSLKSLDQLGIYKIEDETAIDYEELMASLNEENSKEDSSYFVYNKLGQLSNFCYKKYPWFDAAGAGQNVNVVSFLEEKLLQSLQGTSLTIPANNVWLKNVRVQFRNPPHALTSDLELKKKNDNDNFIYTGYRIDAKFSNGESASILVGKDGFYQFPKDLILSELKFPHMNIKMGNSEEEQEKNNTDIVDIDFNLIYNTTTKKELVVSKTMMIKNIIGQDSRNYQPGESTRKNLHLKHYFVDAEATYTQDIGYWKGISIETIPYTVVEILYYNKINEMPEEKGQSFVVGQSGFFNLFEDYYIYDIIFKGRKMFKATNKYAPREHEYIVADGSSSISNPKHQHIYLKDEDKNEWVICWNGKLYPFKFKEKSEENVEGIAEIPVDAILNYKGSIVRRYRSQ